MVDASATQLGESEAARTLPQPGARDLDLERAAHRRLLLVVDRGAHRLPPPVVGQVGRVERHGGAVRLHDEGVGRRGEPQSWNAA